MKKANKKTPRYIVTALLNNKEITQYSFMPSLSIQNNKFDNYSISAVPKNCRDNFDFETKFSGLLKELIKNNIPYKKSLQAELLYAMKKTDYLELKIETNRGILSICYRLKLPFESGFEQII